VVTILHDSAYWLVAALLIASALLAIRAKSLVRAALALAVSSSCLALLFFLLGASYAGAVQLSVGAGLVSTLFLVAISLTEGIGHEQDNGSDGVELDRDTRV